MAAIQAVGNILLNILKKEKVSNVSLPKTIGKWNVIFQPFEGTGIEATDDKFLGEVCSYWGEFDNTTDIKAKYAYPMFNESDKGRKVFFVNRISVFLYTVFCAV